ncbi:MAG TPA: DUF229 domain-containing protein [Gemmatimonadetes bacterium]|nr:DUF229 domain-containing protein [Gemmatimonadota bacterium]
MLRRQKTLIAVLFFAFLALLVACDEKKPNLVIVALDTLRPDHLGVYGYPRETSPGLDARANDYFVFKNAQTSAPWTAPSLVSLMTSLYPDVHQVKDFPQPGRLGSGVTTLAEILKRHGFATGAFTEGGYAKGTFGLDQGFDTFPSNPGDEKSHSSNRQYPSRLAGNFDRFLPWLEARGADEPFFAFFQTYEPHSPLRAPEEYIRMFQPEYDEEAEHALVVATIESWNASREVTADGLRAMQRHMFHCEYGGMPIFEDRYALQEKSVEVGVPLMRKNLVRDAEYLQWVRDLYDAEIRYTDMQLERLWAALEANGQMENTIIVIVSDHGEGLGDHMRMGHGAVLHEEVLNVVFMVRTPDEDFVPRAIEDAVELIDVVPTVLQLMDLNPGRARMQGKSLVPLLRGEERAARPTFTHAMSKGTQRHSVRDGRWRYILEDESGAEQLFDLQTDPGELQDVVAEHPVELKRLRELLAAQRAADDALRIRLDASLEATELDAATQAELDGLGYTGKAPEEEEED